MADWTPAAIETALWLDADDAATITTDGSGNVEQWDDKSGNDRHLSQPSSGLRPAIAGGSVDTSGGKYLFSTEVFLSESHPDIDVFAVFSSDAGEGDYLFSESSVSNEDPIIAYLRGDINPFIRGDGSNDYGINSNEPSLGISWDQGFNVINITNDDRTVTGRKNAVAGSNSISYSGPSGSITTNRLCLGGLLRGSFINETDAQVKEILVLSVPASTEERQIIEGYLAHKWAIESKLPSGHPYKNAAPELPEASFSGNATIAAGDPVDAVLVRNASTYAHVETLTPEANGDWESSALPDGQYRLTYIASGHQPICHGPYTVDTSGS